MRKGRVEKESTFSVVVMTVQGIRPKPVGGVDRVHTGTIRKILIVIVMRSGFRIHRVGGLAGWFGIVDVCDSCRGERDTGL